MEGGVILILIFILIGNMICVIGDSSELSRRKWIFTDEKKVSNSFNKIENTIWIISKFQVKIIFIYCLIIGVKLIFSHGESLYSLSHSYFLFLLITLLISFFTLLKNLFVDSKKYTFLNYKEDFRIADNDDPVGKNPKTFLLFLASFCLMIFFFTSEIFYNHSLIIFRAISLDFLSEDGYYEFGVSLIGLWLTWGLIFADSKIKSKLNTEPSVFELMSKPLNYFISGGKLNMLIKHPEPQNNTSIIFKVGEKLNVKMIDYPSNSDEAETILITDANEHDFVVTKIQDKHLPYFLRKKEYELKAELKSIIGTKKLEIALWLEKI
jgi:hypothetical protein